VRSAQTKRSAAKTGIEERIDKAGRSRYRGLAYDRRTDRKLRGPWTYNLAEARSWRVDAMAKLQGGLLSGDLGPTIREAASIFIDGMKAGSIRNRSGRPYKPSAIRGYERELRNRIIPTFGPKRLAALTLPDLQRWADNVGTEGLAPSTIRNVVNPLRALYGWALPRGLARVNPTTGLRLPSGGKRRDRIAAPEEADRLLSALPELERGIWATAMYAGLRRGELMALRVADIDLEIGVIRIHSERGSYDVGSRTFGSPKSPAAVRLVPIVAKLRTDLMAAVADKPSLALVFGRDANTPFSAKTASSRAGRAWADLAPIGLHESRHTFASYMIAAGLNAKAITTIMGHSSITVTFDRYGHLFPGSEDEARGLLDVYLGTGL
jgi:integrase